VIGPSEAKSRRRPFRRAGVAVFTSFWLASCKVREFCNDDVRSSPYSTPVPINDLILGWTILVDLVPIVGTQLRTPQGQVATLINHRKSNEATNGIIGEWHSCFNCPSINTCTSRGVGTK
jgi:hypothetical protein